MLCQEDWWAVWLGLLMIMAGMLSIWGIDLLGWMVQVRIWEWSDFWSEPAWDKIFASSYNTNGEGVADLSGITSLFVTYLVFTAFTCIGAYFQKLDVKKFFLGFSCLFIITWASWIVGSEAHFKAVRTSQSYTQASLYGENLFCTSRVQTCTKQINAALVDAGLNAKSTQHLKRLQVAEAVDKAPDVIRLSWSLQLGSSFSFVIALFTGLIISHFSKRFAGFLSMVIRPEWFIKTAIVYFGISLGLATMTMVNYSLSQLLTSAAAALVVFLIFWPAMYTLLRRVFGLTQDTAAVLSSGIATGGIVAVLITAAATRARILLPVSMSFLIVLFATLELIGLPKFYAALSAEQPIVNGAAMGLTIKTDRTDAEEGAILDGIIVSNHYRATGKRWTPDLIMSAALLNRFWLDVLMGLWVVVLALLWASKADLETDQTGKKAAGIWFRFPKFILGFVFVWACYVVIATWFPLAGQTAANGVAIVAGPMLNMMFMLAFVAVGVSADFHQLKGMGKLAWLYAVGLLVLVPPVAYLIAYIFHNGMLPVG